LERGRTIAGTDEREPPASDGPRLEGIDGTGSDLSRLLALSDGVFAFALTFLAVTLVLPGTLGGANLPALPKYLLSLRTALVGYVLAFFVIASWWGAHHRLFSSFVRYDPLLVRLNSLFLLVISVTPFLVSLLFTYGPDDLGPSTLSARLAVALYAFVQALGGTILFVVWRHGTRDRRLVARSLPEEWIRVTEQAQLVNIGTFASSIAVAFVSPLAAELIWIVMIFGVSRRMLRRPRVRSGERDAAGTRPRSPTT